MKREWIIQLFQDENSVIEICALRKKMTDLIKLILKTAVNVSSACKQSQKPGLVKVDTTNRFTKKKKDNLKNIKLRLYLLIMIWQKQQKSPKNYEEIA